MIKRRKRQSTEQKSNNYIDNKELVKEVLEFKKQRKKDPSYRIPEELGRYFMMIVDNLANKGNFVNYTYRSDFISDALVNLCEAAVKFDEKISSNAFTYFTTVSWYAFVRRIKKERVYRATIYKSFLKSDLSDDEEISTMIKTNDGLLSYKQEFVDSFEKSLEKKKRKITEQEKNLQNFLTIKEEDNDSQEE